jgi:hypothetical protein
MSPVPGVRSPVLRVVAAAVACCWPGWFAPCAVAQGWPDGEPAAVPAGGAPTAGSTPDSSSLQARTAVALTVRVITSIEEVAPGMSVAEAREKLGKVADPKAPPNQEGGDQGEGKEASGVDRDADADAAAARKKPARGDDDDNEGTRILWKLVPGSEYQWVFIIAGKDQKITAVFGYCWPDKPIPFDQIGDVSKAPIHSPEQVAWDCLKPPLHYRITAEGTKEHAAQVSIFFAAVRTNGVHQPGRRE